MPSTTDFDDDRSPELLEANVEDLGIDTDTSSLNRVFVWRRAELDLVPVDRLGSSSSNKIASSFSVAVLTCGSGGDGATIFALFDDLLDPELPFLRIGGRRVVEGEVLLFSFVAELDFLTAAEGLAGVGVTDLSSRPLSLDEGLITSNFSTAALGLVEVRVR